MRMDRPTRLRGMSTSMTFTLTMSPALTTSYGSLTNFSDSAEMCTRPSWCTPISTKAPKLVTLVTTPSSTMPGLRSFRLSTPSWNSAVLNSGRGSRPGLSSSLRMSVTVGRPKFSSVNFFGSRRLRNAESPISERMSRLVSAAMRCTRG
ncbi:hypothetical protein D3C78_1542990 [compost metagenome]